MENQFTRTLLLWLEGVSSKVVWEEEKCGHGGKGQVHERRLSRPQDVVAAVRGQEIIDLE